MIPSTLMLEPVVDGVSYVVDVGGGDEVDYSFVDDNLGSVDEGQPHPTESSYLVGGTSNATSAHLRGGGRGRGGGLRISEPASKGRQKMSAVHFAKTSDNDLNQSISGGSEKSNKSGNSGGSGKNGRSGITGKSGVSGSVGGGRDSGNRSGRNTFPARNTKKQRPLNGALSSTSLDTTKSANLRTSTLDFFHKRFSTFWLRISNLRD